MPRIHARSLIFLVVALLFAAPPAWADYSRFLEGNVSRFKLNNSNAPTPDLVFGDAQGQTLHLSQFKGRVVLMMIWATWCPYCRMDIPKVDAIQAQMGGANFTVLPISVDMKGAPIVKKFLEKNGLSHLPVYTDPHSEISTAMDGGGLPTFYLFDKNGKEIGRMAGQTDWTTPEARALLSAAISGL